MRRLVILPLLLLVVGFIGAQTPPPITSTVLSIKATYDDGTTVAGLIQFWDTPPKGTALQTATLDATGSASLTLPLSANRFYLVQIRIPAGGGYTTLYEFPFTTALINPANLTSASATVVFRKADSSIKSANVSVAMVF